MKIDARYWMLDARCDEDAKWQRHRGTKRIGKIIKKAKRKM
jgi:hypothetical protein